MPALAFSLNPRRSQYLFGRELPLFQIARVVSGALTGLTVLFLIYGMMEVIGATRGLGEPLTTDLPFAPGRRASPDQMTGDVSATASDILFGSEPVTDGGWLL